VTIFGLRSIAPAFPWSLAHCTGCPSDRETCCHPAKTLPKLPVKTPPISIFLFALAALLGALGQFLYQSGAVRAGGSVASYLGNVRLIAGVICYVAVMILFVAAFQRGGALTTLYPIYASTFIWAAIIARWAYATPIKPVNVCGMLVLIAGMYLLGR
jgi:hypothetical protein